MLQIKEGITEGAFKDLHRDGKTIVSLGCLGFVCEGSCLFLL